MKVFAKIFSSTLLVLVIFILSTKVTLAFQPTAPYYSTFYYPWYKNVTVDGAYSYWNDSDAVGGTHSPSTNWFSNYLPDLYPSVFDPATELYSSNDDKVIFWQLRKMAEAHIEVAITSWWGQGSKEDTAFSHIITDVMNRSTNPYPNLRWAIYYELESTGDPTEATIVDDLTYIYDNYASENGMLKIGGKPVVFVYTDASDGASMAARWASANSTLAGSGKDFYISLKVYSGYGSDPNQPNSWHQYAPASRIDSQGTYSYTVSPGFWKDGESERLCRNLDGAANTNCESANPGDSIVSFDSAIQSMVSSSATWKLVTTWNEWGEGTSVEPGTPVIQANNSTAATEDESGYTFQNSYIDKLNANLPALESGTGQSSFVLATVGDMACGSATSGGSCVQNSVANKIIDLFPDYFLALGDTQYESGAYQDYIDYYKPTFGKFLEYTYPVVGNHEYITANAQGYFDYFNGIGNTTGVAGDNDKGYYAFNLGSNWRVYVLNSNCSKIGGCENGSAQQTWFAADLAANPDKCQIMAMHHPYVSSDDRNFSYYDSLYYLMKDFYDASGEILLVGHSHFYERYAKFAPAISGSTPQVPVASADGVRQFIIGTGGKNVYSFDNQQPLSVFYNTATFGALRLTLNSSSYTWDMFSKDSNTAIDSGVGYCHSSTTDSTNPSAPSSLSSSSPAGTQVDLSWTASTDNVGVEDYKIYRDGNLLTTISASNTSYSDNTVVPTTEYSYYVVAIDASGNTSSNSNTSTVTTTSGTVYASDEFNRTVTDGWGTADVGGTWSLNGTAADFDVTPEVATINVSAAGSAAQKKAQLTSVSAEDVDFVVKFKTDKLATGSDNYVYTRARIIDANNEYRGRLNIKTSNSISLQVATLISGSETFLASSQTVSGLTFQADTYYKMRMQLLGTNPTTIKLKAWADGETEPSTWTYETTDSTPALQTSGYVGVMARLSSTATNAPVLYTLDNIVVNNSDITAPSISNVSTTPSDNGATITWTTDEASSTIVDYEFSNTYGVSTTETDTSPRVTSHSVSLTGLVSCTTYHYRARSKDIAGNQGTSSDATFTTTGCPGNSSIEDSTSSDISTASGGSLSLLNSGLGISVTVPADYSDVNANFQIKKLNKSTVLSSIGLPSGYQAAGDYIYSMNALESTTTAISSFSDSITVQVNYQASDVTGLDESSLKIYRHDGSSWYQLSGCTVDTNAKTVNCTTTSFSTFGLFGQIPANSSSSSSSSGSVLGSSTPQPPVCTDLAPVSAPNLYAAVSNGMTKINLYLSDSGNPYTHYILSFGEQPGQYIYGVENITKSTRVFTVEKLKPGQKYYFRIAGVNGCQPGPWSNEISAETLPVRSIIQNNAVITPIEVIKQEKNQSFEDDKQTQETPATTTVKVKVVDSDDAPVLGAKVTLHSNPKVAYTNETGIATFENVESGKHQLIVEFEGYQGSQYLNIQPNQDVTAFSLTIKIEKSNPLLDKKVLLIIGSTISISVVSIAYAVEKSRLRN